MARVPPYDDPYMYKNVKVYKVCVWQIKSSQIFKNIRCDFLFRFFFFFLNEKRSVDLSHFLKGYYLNHSTIVNHFMKWHKYSYDQATLHSGEFKVWLIILDIKSMKRKEV